MQPDRKDGSASVRPRLTPEEDAALRRWHYFHNLGFTLAEPVEQLWSAMRARDLRAEVREPRDVVQPALPGTRVPTNRVGRALH